MGPKKQSRVWIDPHLVRPAGWSPPRAGAASVGVSSSEALTKEMHIMGVLSSLNGIAQLAYYCRLFYTDTVSPALVLSASWSPWRYPGQSAEAIQSILSYVEDERTRELCQTWAKQAQTLEDLNREWKEALAGFFDLSVPETEQGHQELLERVEIHRQKSGPTWKNRSGFRPLVLRLEQVVAVMQQLQPGLQDLLQSYYSRIRPEDLQNLLGDQRAQDLVNASRGQADHKRAIKLLNRALRYGSTGTQASEVYLELGSRHAALGEVEQAIVDFTKSLEVSKLPNPIIHYWRGELYYQQEQWEQALRDFEHAVSLGLGSPEREQAEQYISNLRSR